MSLQREIISLQNQVDFLNSIESSQWRGVMSSFLGLPGLRGFWPMSAFDDSGNAADISGNGRLMTYNGDPLYGYDGSAPYIEFDGTGDYLNRADEAGLDIVGTEAFIDSNYRGLTMGGWFMWDTDADQTAISKWDQTGNQRSYRISRIASTDAIRAWITTNGTTLVTLDHENTGIINTWLFCVMRFDPSTELNIWVNGSKDSRTATIPASIHSGTADLLIGGFDAGASLNGKASLCFLCAQYLSDEIIDSLFQVSRGLFKT